MDKFKQARLSKKARNGKAPVIFDNKLVSKVVEKVVYERVYKSTYEQTREFLNSGSPNEEFGTLQNLIRDELEKQSKIFKNNLENEFDELDCGCVALVNVWLYQDKLQYNPPLDPINYKTFNDYLDALVDMLALEDTIIRIGARYE